MKKPYFTMAVIAWAIFVVIVLATHVKANGDLPAAEPPQVNASEIGEDPEEEVKIAEALLEQGYFRDDIPLSYEEQDYLHTACEEFGVDHALMLALIEQESNFQNVAGDDGRSVGYCQIQEKWWGRLMHEIGAEDLYQPYDNFRVSAAILAENTAKYGTVGMLKSKSGLNVKHGIVSEGVIDEGYTGTILVKLYNHGPRAVQFRRGDKITQLVVLPVAYPDVVQVEGITGGPRGDDGYGSTGR